VATHGARINSAPTASSAMEDAEGDAFTANADFIQAARCANQTASQSVQHPGVVWAHPRTSFTPTAALLCLREITDTEGVIASINVTDT